MQMLASVMKCNGNTIKTNKNLQKLQGVSVMKSIANKSVKPLLAPIAAFVLAALATPALAHTSSIGFTNTGNGSVTFWFGTYHSGVNYTEGSMQVVSSNSTTTTSAFNLLVSTRPTGLVDGTNNFYSNGTSLVGTPNTTIRYWQGATFTGLTTGTYTFTYLPIANPTSTWQPTNSVILSSTVTLSASLFNSGNIYDSAYGERNSPALSAAKVIDNNSALSNLFSGLTTDQQRSNAASQTLPLLTGSTTNTAKTVLTSVNNIVDSRQYANHGGSSGDDFQVSNEFWMKPFGTIANQADSDGVNGYKVNTAGVAIGADRKINPALTLGVATAFSNSNVHSDISGGGVQGMNVKSYQLIGYGSYDLNAKDSINFQVDAGLNNNTGTREIITTNSVADSSFNSWSAHFGTSFSHSYNVGERITMTPSARVDYTRISESGYSESGAGLLNLNVNRHNAESLIFGLDQKVAYQLNDHVNLFANIGAGYDAMNKQDAVNSSFAGAPSASFVTKGINQGPWLGRGALGVSYKLRNGMEITGRYDAEVRRTYFSQTASVKLNMPF